MKKEIIEAHLYYRIRDISQLKPENIGPKLIEFLNTLKPKLQRSSAQNRALHVDCTLIAEKLNDAGYDMRVVLKPTIHIPWTTKSIKEYIWKPIMKAMFQKESTTELEKNTAEIDKIHQVIMRELGQKWGIEYHPFPHDPKKQKEIEEMNRPSSSKAEGVEYPEEESNPDAIPF